MFKPDVADYVNAWRKDGWKVAVETNGTIALPCHFDHVTVSPKGHWGEMKITECDDLKVVVPSFRLSEYSGMKAKNRFVQPEWGTYKSVNEIRVPRGWRLSIQNHKHWGIA